MVTVFSALVACILLLMFTLSLFISFFTARDKLRFNCADHFFLSTNSSSSSSSCSETIRLFGAAVPDPVFPVTVAVIGVLALLGVGMISYLALFHVYLSEIMCLLLILVIAPSLNPNTNTTIISQDIQ